MSREDVELQWKNWKIYIDNTCNKIDEIASIGEKAYFNTKVMNLYFSKLKNFMVTRKPYIDNYEDLKTKLDEAGDTLFKAEYQKALNEKPNSPKLVETQYKLMKRLHYVLENVIVSLSRNEILPKIKRIDKNVPGAVRYGG